MRRKIALITGVRGQDGSYLAERLLEEDYQVIGVLPHRNGVDMTNLAACVPHTNFSLVNADMTDPHSLDTVIGDARPDEIYNLAAQSFVGRSWDMPGYTMDVNCTGFVHILEAVVRHKLMNHTKIYQASTSEMFGKTPAPQNESTPFAPCSPYGVAKAAAHYTAHNYRDSYGMFICCGILFNHESVRRPEHFLTQKVAKGAAYCARGGQTELRLGNLNAKRDWGWARDYVGAMRSMMQLDEPLDLVIGTGESHTVAEFVERAFERAGLSADNYVKIDEAFVRPVDVPELRADISQARDVLNWEPIIKFHDLVDLMVDHWMEQLA